MYPRFFILMPLKDKRKRAQYQSRYRKLHREKNRLYSAAYYQNHKRELNRQNLEYYYQNRDREIKRRKNRFMKNKKDERRRQKEYRTKRVELTSVRSHHYAIFNPKSFKHRNYKGMPFFDNWNPNKEGSFFEAEKWILLNIGKRPKGSTLHIVDPVLGFVPGNLEWAHPRKQTHQQMCKIIAQQRNQIRKLEEQIKELRRVNV